MIIHWFRAARGPRVSVAAWSLLGLSGCSQEVGGSASFDPTLVTSSGESASATSGSTTATSDETSTTTTATTAVDSSSSGEPVESSSDDNNNGELCGDGIITGSEECDCAGLGCTLEGLGGVQCPDVKDPLIPGPITGGVLGCNAASCRFDTSMCAWCGDGFIIGQLEECEPDVEIDTTCAELDKGTGGLLVCTSDCTLDTTACTDCGYLFDFDSNDCDQGFTSASLLGAPNTWACGDPNAYNLGPGPAKTGVFATNLTGPYSANETSAITSPVLDLSACVDRTVEMTLHHYHNFEGGVINADGGLVQVSEDGASWTTIAPISGSDYGPNALNATGAIIDGDVGFSGNVDDNMWVDSVFDLTPYVDSDSLQVRFVFGSDGSNQQGGWYIDRIEMLGSGA